MTSNHISVREATIQDIPLILDYWYSSSPDYLKAMGADVKKLPPKADFYKMLEKQFSLPFKEKKNYALIWEVNGEPAGHTNINQIHYGHQANMHLHLWHSADRHKGFGLELLKFSLSFFFSSFQLDKLICEPYALNLPPNKVLEKVGFNFIRKYTTTPNNFTFEQEVNRWELSKEQFIKML
ncbi:GNAT family N-acetyltransferase [Algivirga pacifica]|uniref:N-acetyltransferase domain-containing protein n=1 Tax=Algivirga pacifica TaxID=1162670 RepID=A0ABP9D103_9BACT